MRKWSDFVRSISAVVDNNAQQTFNPIVEICGYRRVLIERHMGVARYNTDEILIKVKYGMISLSGMNMHLCKMCKERLVVTGQIDSVTLLRGKQ